MFTRLGRATVLAAALSLTLGVTSTLAHETRDIGDHTIIVGFIGEPVFTGQKCGLELRVTRGEEPVEGLEETLEAEVVFESERRTLPLSPRFGEPGWYESVFFPTAAGPYTFRIFGEIDGSTIDESFTSSEDGFDEVRESTSGQFPVVLPPEGDVARDARTGAEAATTATIALALGGAGLLAGLVAIGLSLARRRVG
jgi:hypothetical protein